MSTKPKKKEKKTLTKTGKRDWSFYAIIICLLILAIPVSLIGFQALSAWSNSRKPIVGDRLDHRYDNVITKEAISSLETDLQSLEGIKEVEVRLVTGTLRINTLTLEGATNDSVSALSQAVYAKVIEHFPVAEYFHNDGTFARYDLEINVHNELMGEEGFIYMMGVKTSQMEEILFQFVSEPLSESWVEELWRRQEERDANNENVDEEPAEGAEEPTE